MASPSPAGGPLNGKRYANSLKVSAPSNLADKLSEMAPHLSVKTTPTNFRSASSLSEANRAAMEPFEAADGAAVAGDTLLQKLGGMVKNAIAPTKSYVELVQRYHKWFHNYKTLQSSSKRQLRDASEVLKEEYAQVDEQMLAEETARHEAEVAGSEAQQQPMDPKRAENMDFIFRALKVVIERLEGKLEELEQKEGIPIDEDSVSAAELEPERDDRVQRAMERVKRTVMNSAKSLLTGEMAIIARTAVFNGLAQYMAAKPDTGDALDHLRPIISLIGSASTPLAVSYLMSIEFRAALAVVNQANPLSLLGVSTKKKSLVE